MPDFDASAIWIVAMVASFALLAILVFGRKPSRLDHRLQSLSNGDRPMAPQPVRQMASQALPAMGKALLPSSAEDRTLLQTRLMHAGLYSRQAMAIFLGVKFMLMV